MTESHNNTAYAVTYTSTLVGKIEAKFRYAVLAIKATLFAKEFKQIHVIFGASVLFNNSLYLKPCLFFE